MNGRTGLERWAPGLAALLRYDPAWLTKDVAAGLSVAAIGLPVGIAYAELTGVPAAVGIYAAIFPLVPYALFGSSRQLILGPDAATCIMVAASLAPLAQGDPARYLALLPVLTLITGALYVVAGLGRLGFFASFLSQPILTGYLNGIAIVIIVGQLPKLLGYPSEADEVLPQLLEFVQRLGQSHLPTALLGLALLAGLLALRRAAPNVPAALAVVVAGIAAVATFDLQAIGVKVTGPVPAGLPTPTWTWFDPATYRGLLERGCRHLADQLHRGRLDRQELRPAQPLRDRCEPGADRAGRGQSRRRPGPGLSRSPAPTRAPRSTTRWAVKASSSASSPPAPCSWCCSCSPGRSLWSPPRPWRR